MSDRHPSDIGPKPTDSEQLRRHNELDSVFTEALMKEHANDWTMEVVREAALICSNTLLLGEPNTAFMQDHDIEVLIDKHDRDVAVLGLKYHGYSTSAAELTRKLSKQLAALILERDQQRLSAVLAEMPKKYEAPGLHRSELSDREYTKQVYYNLGVVHCEQALTAALGPDKIS